MPEIAYVINYVIFHGRHAALCGLQSSSLTQNKDVNAKQSQKCIRMGIIIFNIFILGSILSDIWLEIMSQVGVKLNFQNIYPLMYLQK